MNPDIEVLPNQGKVTDVKADVLVVAVYTGEAPQGIAAAVDTALGGALGQSIADGATKGAKYEAEWVFPAEGLGSRRVLALGAGKRAHYDAAVLRHLAGAAVRLARKKGARHICLALEAPEGVSAEAAARLITDGALCGLSDSDLYKDSKHVRVEQLTIWFPDGAARVDEGISAGRKVASAVNFARWLGDEPSNIMTTVRFAEELRKMAQANNIEFELLEEPEMRERGMNSLLSVSAGSQYPPFVAIMTYRGGDGPPLGLVGKGVMFDSGGISIKPAADMHYMKYDMCGAADVAATIQALAQTGSKANVIAVAGVVENMPGGRATRPGDVVRASNGKTIEIVNTDAEGRLVLADALHLTIERGAERLVDVATLTGSIKVALAELTTGAIGAPQDWVDALRQAAERAGERVWQMPLYPEYRDKLRSNIADMMNTGGRFGGASIAAAFLQQFVGDTPWVHLDVAGTAWLEKDAPYQSKGATGAMIRTLLALADPEKFSL